uniref:Threonylcarbamoyladenosine tRNA methylthiotransferase n=1 Tax=Noctiluca scintillans TaxID=2966 RepID=A0A7S1FK91_NOCSC
MYDAASRVYRLTLSTAGALLAATALALAYAALQRRRDHRCIRPDEELEEITESGVPHDTSDDAAELEDLADVVETRSPWGTASVMKARRLEGAAGVVQYDSREEGCDNLQPGRQSLFVKTFGCAHNSSDSEFMMGLLQDYGYTFSEKLEDADACLINSCTVKGPSQDSAVNITKRAQAAGKPVVLAGCVPTADAGLVKTLDGVSMLSVTQLDRVVEVVEEALKGHVVQLLGTKRVLPSLDLPKVRRNRLVEIIPINAGCLGNCSYCKTKHARGKLSSYSEHAIVGRALQAAGEGVSEVWLTSEDTGAYGIDLGTDIARLLRSVADALPEGVMMKLGMTNPPYMLSHMAEVGEVLQRPNVFSTVHIPVQSGSDAVLKSMVREYSVADFRRLVDGLRSVVPDLHVATDIICGFPAESEKDHEETLALLRHYSFPVLNISQFYPRPGTPAARMKKLQGNVVKRRSGEVTRLFESYETFSTLTNLEKRVWFVETDLKRQQTVGHTKEYAKVVVPRDDALLGRNAMVRIGATTKWHVEAQIIGDVR